MVSNTNVSLPSLRSALQKYGLQNLLNDSTAKPMFSSKFNFFTPISRQPQTAIQAQRGLVVPKFHQQVYYKAAPPVYRASVHDVSNKKGLTTAKDARKRTQCMVHDCSRVARKHKLCFIHGGRSYCQSPGCFKCSCKGGFCISHGGGLRCDVSECDKSACYGGKCYAHNGRHTM